MSGSAWLASSTAGGTARPGIAQDPELNLQENVEDLCFRFEDINRVNLDISDDISKFLYYLNNIIKLDKNMSSNLIMNLNNMEIDVTALLGELHNNVILMGDLEKDFEIFFNKILLERENLQVLLKEVKVTNFVTEFNNKFPRDIFLFSEANFHWKKVEKEVENVSKEF